MLSSCKFLSASVSCLEDLKDTAARGMKNRFMEMEIAMKRAIPFHIIIGLFCVIVISLVLPL